MKMGYYITWCLVTLAAVVSGRSLNSNYEMVYGEKSGNEQVNRLLKLYYRYVHFRFTAWSLAFEARSKRTCNSMSVGILRDAFL